MIGVSNRTSAPVFGLIRKFRPVSVTTRMRSTVGLKSNPKFDPVTLAIRPPMGVANPVRALTE